MKTSSFRFWACPATGTALVDDGRELVSIAASTEVSKTTDSLAYPKVGGLPWLFPDPKHVLANWRERIDLLLQTREQEIEELKQAHKTASSKLTKSRLEILRRSKISQLELLKKVLDPMKPGTKLSLSKKKAFGYRLPFNQGLLGYFPNLARDWSVGNPGFDTENQVLLNGFTSLLPRTLMENSKSAELNIAVLGCGAGRLPYDIAKLFPRSHVVAIDINPLLLLAGNMLNSGASLKGIHPSASPKNRMQPASDVDLAAPNGPAENLEFAFADVYALPFQNASFDVVLTPWLIDILPRSFASLAASIAQIVKTDGHWVNCGAWFFNFQNEEDNISLEEAKEIGVNNGWDPIADTLLETPYLQSELDSHRRYETMTGFVWKRTSSQVTYDNSKRLSDKVDWLNDPTRPIPQIPAFTQSIESLSTMAWVLSQVDGKKTLKDLTKSLVVESGLEPEAAQEALESFFDRYLKDRTFRERS